MKVEELSRTVHVSAGGAFHPGGGDQETGFAHRSEREMLNEHPTSGFDSRKRAATQRRRSQRLRAHRGDHELHEHEQS